MPKVRGYNVISGSWGQVWWDGELIMEVSSFEARVIPDRADVNMAGSLDTDSKIIGLKGEGSMRVKKMFTRGVNKILKAWNAGEDPRSQLIGKLKDPNTIGKQSERVVLDNVWFNEMTLMQFETGQLLEREIPFGFTPGDADFQDTIEVR